MVSYLESDGRGEGRKERDFYETHGRQIERMLSKPTIPIGWSSESGVGRVVNGVPTKLDKCRIRGLGNAIVPQVAFQIMQAIKELDLCQ